MTTPTSVDFVAQRLPALPAGTYTISAHQQVGTLDGRTVPPTTFQAPAQELIVAGPRWVLPPAMVTGVFPPPGSLGDHTTVLPHVRLAPATLPWQRSARTPAPADDATTDDADRVRRTPWLALLVLDADEVAPVSTVSIADLAAADADWWPLAAEPGESPEDPVAVIDVPAGTLRRLLPTVEELGLLTHVRERREAGGSSSAAALVVANRLPAASQTTTVHLVSLEHRVHRSPAWRYRFADLAEDASVRLVSLHHWSFSCTTPAHSFHGLGAALDRNPATLRLPTAHGLRGRVSCDPAGTVLVTHEHGVLDPFPAGIPAPGGADFGPAVAVAADGRGAVRIERPFTDAERFSIAAWVRPAAADGTERPIVGGLDPADAVPGMSRTAAGALVLTWADDRGGRHRSELPAALADADTWVHVCWVRDGRADRIWIDGAERAVLPVRGRLPVGPADLWVGRAGSVGWGGLLADVRVYDRNLDAAEVPDVQRADRTHQPELAGRFTSRGLVPVEHRLRQGGRAVSWLRSPLAVDPAPTNLEGDLPRHGDGYLEYHDDVGMLDVTLAAAWELGRQLMLRSRAEAVALYRWKRRRRRDRHRADRAALAPHLPTAEGLPDGVEALPDGVLRLLDDLALLRGVPVNYLLPDPQLLPPESLRVVRVDPVWVSTLLHGALTVGDQTSFDRDRAPRPEVLRRVGQREVGGLLLRSRLVTGWPTLVVRADAAPLRDPDHAGSAPLDVLRKDEIAPGVLLCLFEGHPATVDLHVAPEEIHCGVEVAETTGELRLGVRAPDGVHTGEAIAPVPFRPAPAGLGRGGVLDLAQLRDQLSEATGRPVTEADLALQLVAGVPRLRFILDGAVDGAAEEVVRP